MTTKLLLSTVVTTVLIFGMPAYSAEDKHTEDKGHVHCDPAKDKNCKDEHPAKHGDHGKKADEKHEHKEGNKHDHGHEKR